MKNSAVAFVLTFIASWGISLIGEWWWFAFPSFLVGLFFYKSSKNAFWIGFLSITVLWTLVAALSMMGGNTDFIHQILSIFTTDTPLNNIPAILLLMLIFALTGGLIGGFSSLVGHESRKLFVS